MSALVLAAALASTALPPKSGACDAAGPQQAASASPTPPHALGDEPAARRMHAVLRQIGGCVVVDVSATRAGAQVWEYRLAGPAGAWPRPAAVPGR